MLTLRPASARFHTQIDWLDSWHSFSFGEHHDPSHMGFSDLRVINDDIINGGGGFGTHGHRDMEIITVVLSGALEHKDSLGNGSVILPGDVQKMSAGRGILHSEFNGSATEPVRLLQLWIMPNVKGVEPAYWQKHFTQQERNGRFCLVVSPDATEGSLPIYQDSRLYVSDMKANSEQAFTPQTQRKYWVQAATGSFSVNGQHLVEGDGLAIAQETSLHFIAQADSTLLLFELAA